MKIALVIYQYTDAKGGVERYVSDLAKGLIERKHQVHIFCHKYEKSNSKNQKSQIVIHPVPVSGSFYAPWRLFSFAHNVARMLRKEKFDLIQGFGRTYYQDILRFGSGSHWEYLKHTHPEMAHPLGRLIQKLNPRNHIVLSLEKKSLTNSFTKKIVCISNLCKRESQQYYHVPNEKLVVIYNGIDLERFSPDNREKFRNIIRQALGLNSDELMILFVGSGFHRKGLRYAIEALAKVNKSFPVKMVVIGKGRIKYYRSLAQKRGVGEQILFLGMTDQIERYYAAADIFLFPTLYDAFGTVVLEAMASGLSVLVSSHAGASELLTHSVDSFILDDPSDTDQIAQRIEYLADPIWRENMGRSARATALKYSFQRNLDQMLKVYQEVLEKNTQ